MTMLWSLYMLEKQQQQQMWMKLVIMKLSTTLELFASKRYNIKLTLRRLQIFKSDKLSFSFHFFVIATFTYKYIQIVYVWKCKLPKRPM